MTPADLDAWRSRMGYSVREACRELEISQDRWRRMMAGGRIPRHIMLACGQLVAIRRDRMHERSEYA